MAGRTILTVDVQGGPALIAKLGKVAAAETLAAPLQKAGERLQRAMQGYPPELPNQTYERTGDLGNSWKDPVISGLTATVKSSIAYGPFVQGDQAQTAPFRGRWITGSEAIELEAPTIQRDFQEAIDAALK